MTTERQTASNQRNARRSVGPRSRVGKARSSRNALKHGLAVSILSDPHMTAEVSSLAQALVGEARGDATLLAHARAVAEAELEVVRVRMARARFLSSLAADPATFAPKMPNRVAKIVFKAAFGPGRIENPMFDLVRAAIARLPGVAETGPEREALVLSKAAGQLMRFDRYERRAMSRRNSAIRAFEAARLGSDSDPSHGRSRR